MLDGRYGGEGEGTDANGTVLHQVTKWTFKHGKIDFIRGANQLPGNSSTSVCDFVPDVAAALSVLDRRPRQ